MDVLARNPAFYRELGVQDRCDRCIAQAFTRAIKTIDGREYELLFCGHHYNRNEPKLIADGWLTQDDRELINQKPMSGTPDYVASED
jgi:hypothetical protein